MSPVAPSRPLTQTCGFEPSVTVAEPTGTHVLPLQIWPLTDAVALPPVTATWRLPFSVPKSKFDVVAAWAQVFGMKQPFGTLHEFARCCSSSPCGSPRSR